MGHNLQTRSRRTLSHNPGAAGQLNESKAPGHTLGWAMFRSSPSLLKVLWEAISLSLSNLIRGAILPIKWANEGISLSTVPGYDTKGLCAQGKYYVMGPASVSVPSLGLSFLLHHSRYGYLRKCQPNAMCGLSGP